jgi:hypothetical protein
MYPGLASKKTNAHQGSLGSRHLGGNYEVPLGVYLVVRVWVVKFGAYLLAHQSRPLATALSDGVECADSVQYDMTNSSPVVSPFEECSWSHGGSEHC